MSIAYRKIPQVKYQMTEDYSCFIPILDHSIEHAFFSLKKDGKLMIKAGYAWDGPSGPTFDTKSFMRGSLVHDVIYQMLREGLLEHNYRLVADKLLRQMCIEDGMWRVRAWGVYRGVRLAGNKYTMTSDEKPKIYKAP